MTNKDKDCEALVVADKPTETGIKLNNILTALVLMVMSWVGFNINHLKDSLADIQVSTSVQASEIAHNKERFERHIRNKRLHN
jgi:hypothetical protein